MARKDAYLVEAIDGLRLRRHVAVALYFLYWRELDERNREILLASGRERESATAKRLGITKSAVTQRLNGIVTKVAGVVTLLNNEDSGRVSGDDIRKLKSRITGLLKSGAIKLVATM